MAIEGSFSPHIIIHKSFPFRKPIFGFVIFRKSQLPVKKAITLQIKSSIRDQVFEDHSKGIICYKDDSGEIICEGLDEGPRHHPEYTLATSPLRDASIHELLQQRWIQIMEGDTENDSPFLKGHSCNGFNTLH